jgi:hypothetical protein
MIRVTYPSEVYRELFKLRPAAQVASSVLRALPSRKQTEGKTMRSCVGMMNMSNAGFAVFCPWTFTASYNNGEWAITFPDEYNPPVEPLLQFHPEVQHGDFLKDYNILKVSLPTTIRDTTERQYLFHGPTMLNPMLNGDATVISGITDFKYVDELNIFIALRKVEGAEYKFNTGDVLFQLIPITEEEIELDHVVGYPRDYMGTGYFSSAYKSAYFKIKDFYKRVGS